MSAEADVYRGSTLAGRLTRTRTGAVFEYDDRFAKRAPSGESGIAFGLPYAARRFETHGVNLHTFFAGLLPEGLRLRALVRRVKTSEDDLLGLLVEAGADCVGDVSVVRAGKPLVESTPLVDVARPAATRFRDVLRESLGSPKEATIPGVQQKVSAAMISLPVRAARASYILKLNPPDVPRLVENEGFFMTMARACGLETAEVRLVHDSVGEAGLLVTRFDRVRGAKLHQEDVCQILDRYPADKYRLSTADVFRALDVCSAPRIERARLLRLVAFSYLVGNGDLHAKNVSVRVVDGRVELTPAYDLLSSFPYGDKHMALKLDAHDDNLRRSGLVAFAGRFDVPPRAVTEMLDELLDRASSWVPRLGEIGFDGRRTGALARLMAKRAKDLRGGRR